MSVNYSDLTPGTAVVWENTGGDHVLNAKNLSSGSARQGDKSLTLIDGTKGFPEVLEVIAEVTPTSAPTAGNTWPIYIGYSKNSTGENVGGLGDSDAAVTNVDQLPQLSVVGSIVASNAIGTGVQRQRFWVVPKAEYAVPVLYNNSGVATANTDSTSKITIRPWYRRNPVS